MKHLTSWLSAALFGLALFGVPTPAHAQEKDKKDDKKEVKAPATPADALLMATEGLLDNDEAKVKAAIKTEGKQDDLIKALMKFVSNAQKFETAFTKEYGADAWKRFNDPKIDPGAGEGNATLTLQSKDDAIKAAKAAKIEEKGDTASTVIEQPGGKKTTWKFVKVKDGWQVSADTFTEGGQNIDMTIKILDGFADLLPKYQKAIGKKDGEKKISADDIDIELGKALIKQLFGLETKPPRFDVSKFKE